ncbi:uncharacterized protein LOC114319860 isoform X3 [Camellia sinensis]|uniref:uncharacterized protein LOC114319860 isoform X3 n=1 Tax=Camellia sinensis TaxID=4442 RepID=UPI001035BDC7|nr:uncharacterized protein LOC114319860 isoform X3 [Camellia sinensis]
MTREKVEKKSNRRNGRRELSGFETQLQKNPCYKNDIGQTFYSEQDLMRYINYAKRAKVSINAPRPNPPKVRKEAGKAAAVKQRSKGLMHASNQSDEESDNPEVVSLPSELPKKVRRDKAPNSASASDDEDAEFHLSNYYQ